MFGEHLADLGRDGTVDVEAGRHEDQLGAFALCRDGRHRGANAEGAGLVACGSHHAARSGPANGKRLAAQGRIVALFDRRVKRIHVDMDDLTLVGAAVRGHMPAMHFARI